MCQDIDHVVPILFLAYEQKLFFVLRLTARLYHVPAGITLDKLDGIFKI